MPTKGFHSEWITVKSHRILLECRASFPDEMMKFVARVAVEMCDSHTENEARVVHLFYDDKSCIWTTTIASTNPGDASLDRKLERILSDIFGMGNFSASVEIVKMGNKNSDHYHHMEHLSVGADVAVDRFRHSDKKYMGTVDDPS